MAVSNQLKNQHLFWRAGFGVASENAKNIASVSQTDIYNALVKTSAKKPEYLDVAKNLFDGVFKGIGEAVNMEKIAKEVQNADADKKREFRQKSRDGLKSLNLLWLDDMVNTNAQLREKMAFFWHGHFACRDINIYFQQILLDELRTNALGNFKDLLFGISKSAAMLSFLNNQQNKKSHPNENFAREVMELFTMGRGNYTENDIKEAARAFTGWGFNIQGEFVFKKFQHDTGSKTILGKTGNFDGDDVLNILLEQKQTAQYITKKIYRHFVNDNVDEAKVKWLADRFYQSGYEIEKLMKDIFTSDWFYDAKNIGTRIKSPIELLAGIRRLIPMDLDNDDVQLLMQRALGQVLFYPPNVAGWPGGKTWIDSSSLMLRMRIPQLISDNADFAVSAKTDDDQTMGMMEQAVRKKMMAAQSKFKINATVDWAAYTKQFDPVSRENLFSAIEHMVLQTGSGAVKRSIVEKAVNSNSRETFIKSATVALMCTPEYQLC